MTPFKSFLHSRIAQVKTVHLSGEVLFREIKELLNQSFYQFAKSMGFIPKLCHTYRPQTKGKVDRLVRNVRDNFFCPLNTKLQALGMTIDTSTANAEVRLLLETVAHQVIHHTTKQKPDERLVEERKA